MAKQEELFPPSIGFQPDTTKTEPLLWVKELRIYHSLVPGDNGLLRKIELQPGLNVLWAKPRERSSHATQVSPRISGHGTGKTTFCRFLRYLLGESTFGNDEQRQRLRDVFPHGWVVGEVHLDGVSWLIRRPFRNGQHSAVKGLTIDALFSSEEHHGTIEDYRQELTKVLAEPLPVASFATAPTPIEWAHLVQWLTRDQECRFAGLAELRHTSSDSQSPSMVVEDIHFLFRAVLELIDAPEQLELENNKKLLKERHDAEHRAPLLRFRGEAAYEVLRAAFPEFRGDLEGADYLTVVEQEWSSRAKASAAQLANSSEPKTLKEARERLLEAQASLRKAEHKAKESQARLEWIEQQSLQLKGEATPVSLKEWLQTKLSSDFDCGHSLAEAIEWECPLAVGRKLPIESAAKAVPVAQLLADLEVKKGQETLRLKQVQGEENRLKAIFETGQSNLKTETEAYDLLRGCTENRSSRGFCLAQSLPKAQR